MSDYSILTAAAERAAEKGTTSAEEEGRLLEHHQYRLWQIVQAHDVERAALTAKAERLQGDLQAALAAITQINARIASEAAHDLAAVRSYMTEAPQYRDNRAGRTFPLPYGPMRFRSSTKAAGAVVVDEAAARELFPEFVKHEEKLLWGDVKKARLQIAEDGRVYDKATGEVIDPAIIAGTPRQTEERQYITVSGIEFDLTTGGTVDDADRTDEDSSTDEPAGNAWWVEDPFGD